DDGVDGVEDQGQLHALLANDGGEGKRVALYGHGLTSYRGLKDRRQTGRPGSTGRRSTQVPVAELQGLRGVAGRPGSAGPIPGSPRNPGISWGGIELWLNAAGRYPSPTTGVKAATSSAGTEGVWRGRPASPCVSPGMGSRQEVKVLWRR